MSVDTGPVTISHDVSPDGLELTSTAVWADGASLSSTASWPTVPMAFEAHDAVVAAFTERVTDTGELPPGHVSVRAINTPAGKVGVGTATGQHVFWLPRAKRFDDGFTTTWLGFALTVILP